MKLVATNLVLIGLCVFTLFTHAGDNHVHIDQVNSGNGFEFNVDQIGYDNKIDFSFDHANNEFNLSQVGGGNLISWVPWWGSGKGWGGDVDGSNNTINIDQQDGATYGAHVWGNNNTVDIYQDGTHETFLDIHASNTDVDIWQEDSGDKYAQVYFYGNSSYSTVDMMQKGTGAHSATITLQGSYETDLTLTQQGSTAQTYTLTQNCATASGCSVSVTQGN